MTDRERFERTFPIPQGMAYSHLHKAYLWNGRDINAVEFVSYNSKWKGWISALEANQQDKTITQQEKVTVEIKLSAHHLITPKHLAEALDRSAPEEFAALAALARLFLDGRHS